MSFWRHPIVFLVVLSLATPVGAGASAKAKLATLACTAILSGFLLAPDTSPNMSSESPADVFTSQMRKDFSSFGSGVADTTSVLVGALANGAEMIPVNWVNVSDFLNGQNGAIIWLSDAQRNASKFYSEARQWTFNSAAQFIVGGIYNQALNDLNAGKAVLILFMSNQASERGQAVSELSATSARALDITLGLGGLMFVGGGLKFALKRSGTGVAIRKENSKARQAPRINVRLRRTAGSGHAHRPRDLRGELHDSPYVARVEVSDATIELPEFPGIKMDLYRSDPMEPLGQLKIEGKWYSTIGRDLKQEVEDSLLPLTQLLVSLERSFHLELNVRDSLNLLWHVHGDKFQAPFLDRNISHLGTEVGLHLVSLVQFIESGAYRQKPFSNLVLMVDSKYGRSTGWRKDGESRFLPEGVLNDFIEGILSHIPDGTYDNYAGENLVRYGRYLRWSRDFIESMMKVLSESGIKVGNSYREKGVISFTETRRVLEQLKQ